MSIRRVSVMEKIKANIMQLQDEERPESFKDTLKDLAENCSLHGIPKIVHSRQLIVKVLWCLLFIAAFTVFTIQLYFLFETFYSYPSQTSVSLVFSPIGFPAITLCNMNPVRKSQLYKTDELQSVLNSYSSTNLYYRKKREATKTKEKTQSEKNGQNGIDFELTKESHDQTEKGFKITDKEAPVVQPNRAVSHAKQMNNDSTDDESWKTKPDLHQAIDKLSKLERLKGIRRRKREATESSYGFQSMSSVLSSLSDKISSTPGLSSSPAASSFATNFVLQPSTVKINSSPLDSSVATTSVLQQNTVELTSSPALSSFSGYSAFQPSTSYSNDSTSMFSSINAGIYPSSSQSSYAYSSSSDYWYDYGDWTSWYSQVSNYDYWSSWNDYSSGGLFYYDQFTSSKDKWDERVENFRQIIKNESAETRKDIGQQKEDMIQSATFAGRIQNISHFQPFMSTEYGNCYTISSPKYVAWRSGPAHGIKLTLNLELDEYVDNFSPGYGIRIVFHEPGTYPLPSHEGITLSPATETNIGLRMVRISRLGEPHGNCIDGTEFEARYHKKYSISACYEFCRIQTVIQECECIPVEAPDEVDFNSTSSVCNVSKTAVKKCLLDVDVMFDNGAFSCDCRGPCKETVYAKTMSSTFWPTDDYLALLISDVCETKNGTGYWNYVCNNFEYMNYWELDKYRYNFLRVLVYYEDLNYESITEEPMYESVRFLSDIGGAMGLFLGASVLSFVEGVQLILEVFLHIKHRAEKKNRVTDIRKSS